MCRVYEFPKQQMELPKEEADLLKLLGEAYVKALNNALIKLVGNDTSHEKMEAVNVLVHQAFLSGMDKAINEMDES